MKIWTTMTIVFLCCFSYFSAEAQEKGDKPSDTRKEGVIVQEQRPPAKVEEASLAVTVTAALGVYNKYIFRGYEMSRGSIVVQPAMSASYAGFTMTWWGNIDSKEHATQNFTPDRPDRRSFDETDLTLCYTHTKGKWSFTGGYIYYGTKYTDETQEVFGTIAHDMTGKPTLSIYRDIDRYPGTYFNFSLSHSIKIYHEVALDLGASAGYMWGDSNYWRTYESSKNGYTGEKYSAFHDGMVKAGLTIPITKKISFVPLVQYWFPLSGKASRQTGGNSYNPNGYLGTNFVGGASITYNF